MATSAHRLGALVRERRIALGIYTVVEAAGRAGLTGQTWAKIERGEPAKPATYRKVEDALGWEHGSCGRILDGGEPVTARLDVATDARHEQQQLRDALSQAADALRVAGDAIQKVLQQIRD